MQTPTSPAVKPFYMHLSTDEYHRLAHLAVDRGVSKSALVRQWIRQGLAQDAKVDEMYRAMSGER